MELRIRIRRCTWEADEPRIRSPQRHFMGKGGFEIHPSMRYAVEL